MSGLTKEDKIKNEYVIGSTGVALIVDKMKKNRLKWFGHVIWKEVSKAVRTVIKLSMEGRRGRGRLKKKWLNRIECVWGLLVCV